MLEHTLWPVSALTAKFAYRATKTWSPYSVESAPSRPQADGTVHELRRRDLLQRETSPRRESLSVGARVGGRCGRRYVVVSDRLSC